jgi:hypothetical protein
VSEEPAGEKERMAETIRQVVSRRERAPRSPRMERALKRLLWRYTQRLQDVSQEEESQSQERRTFA